MVVFVISVSVALGISFLCSLMEATLLSLSPSQIADLGQRHPQLAKIWLRFKERIDRPIAIILILNTTAHTIGASFAGSSFGTIYGSEWLWLFSLLFTFVMLQFTELLPKSLGVRYNKAVARVIARPLDLAATLLSPVVTVLHLLNRPFQPRHQAEERVNTVEEISALAGMARLTRQINPQQERIIAGATRLSQQTAQDLMISRDYVSTLDCKLPLAEALVTAHIDAHTRYPVLEDGRYVGYVNFKEIVAALRTNPANPSIRGILHPLVAVGPQTPASELLKRFVDQHLHIAQVVDQVGQPLGILTMEDMIEELMGDLEDEFDRLPRHSHQLDHGLWQVGGGVPVAELPERCRLDVGEREGSFSDWLLARVSGPAKAGMIIQHGAAQITLRRLRRGKIFEATVSLS